MRRGNIIECEDPRRSTSFENPEIHDEKCDDEIHKKLENEQEHPTRPVRNTTHDMPNRRQALVYFMVRKVGNCQSCEISPRQFPHSPSRNPSIFNFFNATFGT